MVQEMQGERPSIMKWMWYKKRWFPSFTEFIDHKDQIRCYPVQDGESSPVIWCRRYSYLEKYIQTC